MRYDSFYASVLDSTNKIPSNIKILSWNYDSQFELAFTEYSNSANFKEIETELGILKPKYSIEPNKKHNIFKINGTADFYEDGKTDSLYFLNRSSNKLDECISEILSQYSLLKVTSNTHTRLRFAWETNGIMPNDVVTVACEEISQTDVLVVIGYSFPFFNREVDRRIINSMGRLEKIYIQDLDPKDVFERFKAVRDGFENLKFIPINKVKQFFLPNEL
jgi:hypothetical protein